MHIYEKCFKTLKEAKTAQALTGGSIKERTTLDENENIIIMYVLTYKQLF